MALDRTLARILEQGEKDGIRKTDTEGINGRALRCDKMARHIIRELKTELDRDEEALEDLGLVTASLQTEDGDPITAWVYA